MNIIILSLLFISQTISTFVLKWWGHHCWLVCAIFLPSNTNLIDINQTYHWIVIEYGSSVNNLTFLAMLRGWSTDAVWKHFANSLSTETWRHNPFLNGSQCTYMYGIRPALHKHGNLEFMNNITETHPPLLPHWYKSSVNESKGVSRGLLVHPKPKTCLIESSNILWLCIITLSALSDHLFFEFRISRLTLQIWYCGKTLRAPHFYPPSP